MKFPFQSHIFLLIAMMAAVSLCAQTTSWTDWDSFEEFHVRQDPSLRMFHVFEVEDDEPVGTVVSSNYGILDFYDQDCHQHLINNRDLLFDVEGNLLGSFKVLSDNEWFSFSEVTRIEFFSPQEQLLFTLEAELNKAGFVFRDADTRKLLAVAIWTWIPAGKCPISWLDTYIQDWSVIIVDRSRMQAKNIPAAFLVSALLKHSQKHLPGTNNLNFVDKPCGE